MCCVEDGWMMYFIENIKKKNGFGMARLSDAEKPESSVQASHVEDTF